MKKNENVKIQIAVNFDLIVKECKAEFGGSRSKAYDIIKKDLLSNGFYHDQGSGYISKLPMTKPEILDTLGAFFERNQWLDHCCKRLRVTQVGNELFNGTAHQELLSAMRAMVNAQNVTEIPTLPRVKSGLEKETERQLAEHQQAHLAEVEAMDIPPERKAELRQKVDEIYSVKPPTIAEIKAEIRGKSPKEIAELSRQAQQKNKQNGKNSSNNTGKPPSGNGSGGNSGR